MRNVHVLFLVVLVFWTQKSFGQPEVSESSELSLENERYDSAPEVLPDEAAEEEIPFDENRDEQFEDDIKVDKGEHGEAYEQ